MVEVVLDREECTSCGNCVEVDETKFTFDDDDKATIIGSERDDGMDEIEVDDASVYEEAAEKCQGECIEVYDD
ncbi:ferredoxin [Candidatus Methanosphaera massiliense]|jgi:ferredoxin|uniref:ferredoxin n=1 Tax=Methanosphaera TaxID=2316 RepID=UPI00237FE31E|nr:ferredoxin [Candidatus Methanosphaera massiliense]MDD6285505.1 ferredoxin [Methanobacteriaceae archaeon]MDE4078614.1 ferredoxin [Candidatus Methanosphaera massiliense]MDY2744137.1 ferredoxin [Methanosphaera sp.]